MKNSLSIIFAVLISTFSSCEKNNPDPKNANTSALVLKGSVEEYLDATSNPSNETSDPFELNGIVINGDKVEVSVSYPGGCAQHTFEIIWDQMIMYSDPPQINMVIIHDNNGDICEAYITEVITFELDSLIGSIGIEDISIDGYSGWDAGDSAVYEGEKLDFSFEESDICNITVTAREAMCGWGLYDNTWFALEDSVNAGIPGYYYNMFLQPVSIVETLAGFVPEPGKKYTIGARIDKSSYTFGDGIICLAYPGPSVPVKIMCIAEIK
jgi:hypothetical protein